MSWYRPGVSEIAFVVILVAGYAFEWPVAAFCTSSRVVARIGEISAGVLESVPAS
jgi:hypothetical protein